MKTKNGFKKIEEIQIGDMVLTRNETTGEVLYRKVTELFYNKVDTLFAIKLVSGDKIETTWNHPFWVENKGWTEAKDILAGNRLVTANGVVEVESNKQVYVNDIGVYNFEVDETHSYFVGRDGVWVHNYLNIRKKLYNDELTFFEGVGERFSNLFEGNGFRTYNDIIEENVQERGDFKGIQTEIEAKLSYGMKLTIEEQDFLLKNDRVIELKQKDNLSKNEKNELSDLEQQLEAKELGHSLDMFERWKEEGREEVPLTPFIKNALKQQFDGLVDLDEVRNAKKINSLN